MQVVLCLCPPISERHTYDWAAPSMRLWLPARQRHRSNGIAKDFLVSYDKKLQEMSHRSNSQTLDSSAVYLIHTTKIVTLCCPSRHPVQRVVDRESRNWQASNRRRFRYIPCSYVHVYCSFQALPTSRHQQALGVIGLTVEQTGTEHSIDRYILYTGLLMLFLVWSFCMRTPTDVILTSLWCQCHRIFNSFWWRILTTTKYIQNCFNM